MAQAALEFLKYKKSISTSTQTNNLDEFYVNLSSTKHARLHYSESYKDMVLSFNINQSKSFIITRQMWNIFKLHLNEIDKILS